MKTLTLAILFCFALSLAALPACAKGKGGSSAVSGTSGKSNKKTVMPTIGDATGNSKVKSGKAKNHNLGIGRNHDKDTPPGHNDPPGNSGNENGNNGNDNGNNGGGNIPAVPEPATLALLGLGLTGLAGFVARRKLRK